MQPPTSSCFSIIHVCTSNEAKGIADVRAVARGVVAGSLEDPVSRGGTRKNESAHSMAFKNLLEWDAFGSGHIVFEGPLHTLSLKVKCDCRSTPASDLATYVGDVLAVEYKAAEARLSRYDGSAVAHVLAEHIARSEREALCQLARDSQ